MTNPSPSGWPAARTAHLAGGCRAINGFDPVVRLFPTTMDRQELSFQLREYGSLYAGLEVRGIAPIGFEFLSTSLDARGLVPTDWRSFHPWGGKNVWPCHDQMDEWAQIAYAASKSNNADLWDLARRLSHQLRVCAWRLYQVSEAYHAQLRARTADPSFKAGTRFTDGFTWLAYLAVQAFLVDACVLRDYLAEFFVAHICPESARPSAHIATMAGAKKHVLNKIQSADPIFAELSAATSKDGWLFLLGAYRDLSVHCVPLARAGSKLWALGTEFPIKGANPLTGVSLPLPADPSGIAAARASPKRTDRLVEELRLMTSASLGEVSHTDALAYCYASLDALTRLTIKMRKHSPVEPEIPLITEKDVIGEIEIRRV